MWTEGLLHGFMPSWLKSGDLMRLWRVGAIWVGAGALVPGGAAPRAAASRGAAAPDLPARLTDQEFWALSSNSSEPGGFFRAADITNLTSNELLFQHVIPELTARAKVGGVYLGVGPEQNY